MHPPYTAIDHVHVHVRNREAAEVWYGRVMGLFRVETLAGWAADGGPLTLSDASGAVHIALFERPNPHNHATIALATTAAGLLQWQNHLQEALGIEMKAEDHDLSWSLYFSDPDGNPYEITSYDYEELAKVWKPKP